MCQCESACLLLNRLEVGFALKRTQATGCLQGYVYTYISNLPFWYRCMGSSFDRHLNRRERDGIERVEKWENFDDDAANIALNNRYA